MSGGALSGADGSRSRRAGALLGALSAAGMAWGWFEAGWVRLRRRELVLPELPAELDGLRIAHLSDFHLGIPSRGSVAVERAVDWVAGLDCDLVCVTGDLLSRPRGEPRLRALLRRLGTPWVVLGNHDLARTRDPFSIPVQLEDLSPAPPARRPDRRGGAARPPRRARRRRPALVAGAAPERLPGVGRRPADPALPLPERDRDGAAGALPPDPGRAPARGPDRRPLRLRQAAARPSPRARYREGVHEQAGTVMHVSPGLGTTFVPFRFAARPEATELVLRRPRA